MSISFDDFLIEAIDNDIRVIIITSRKKSGGYFKTSGKIKELCDKMNIKNYIVYAEEAYIIKDDEGKLRIYNSDDKRGFRISKNNTVAIIRNSVTKGQASLDLVSQLERYKIFCVNSRQCIEECYDKYRTYLKMSDAKIPTPRTALITNEVSIDISHKKVGGKFPCVVKTLTGEQGVGVFIVDSSEGLKSTLQTIWKLKEKTEVIIQEYLEANYDMRIHILGGKVITGMKRFKIKKDFRSNYSLGGSIGELKISDKVEEVAILAAKSVGAVWAGVDIMETKDGKLYVIEINASPGTDGIEKASKIPVTKKVIKHITNKDNWLKTPTECGYIETVNIESMGDMKAKMDTGNGSYCVIHSDKWEIEGKYVTWTNNGNTYEHKLDGMKRVRTMGKMEERPSILLNVTFNGDTYKDVKFTISNREQMSTPILLNRTFIRQANLVINPAKKYALSLSAKEKSKEPTNEEIKSRIRGWFE
jgi:ribosomal protein S6--L-glutamate ligase